MIYKQLTWLDSTRRIHRLAPESRSFPGWSDLGSSLAAVVRTPEEITVITDDDGANPAQGPSSGPWSTFRVRGAIPHDVTGVLAGMSTALAEAGIPIFVVSTFDTDYVMVPTERMSDTSEALARAGYRFENTP